MKECEQAQGMSVLQHGESVKEHLFDLINHLRTDEPLKYEWKLPEWVVENKELFLASLPDNDTLELYTVYHDCGKPFCLEFDEQGRHFPDHCGESDTKSTTCQVSYNYFKQAFDNDVAAELILHDMDIHLLKADGVNDFCKNPYALTLLLTGLSEIHSNSKMFGGMDSLSFKIKWKSINQRGKAILKKIKEENEN
jgi:hypothetical protein